MKTGETMTKLESKENAKTEEPRTFTSGAPRYERKDSRTGTNRRNFTLSPRRIGRALGERDQFSLGRERATSEGQVRIQTVRLKRTYGRN